MNEDFSNFAIPVVYSPTLNREDASNPLNPKIVIIRK
jgi:hypothetical protein